METTTNEALTAESAEAAANGALRFEDLTIDDDLPLLDRVVRYCRSGIALQRLVHVKMLAETAETVGTVATLRTLVPLLLPLVSDPESVIRQHLASQLLPLSIMCMVQRVGRGGRYSVAQIIADPTIPKDYYSDGYKIVTSVIVLHLNSLVADPDVDVRRSASESLSGLALQIHKADVVSCVLPIPTRLAQLEKPLKSKKGSSSNNNNNTSAEQDGFQEELRITASSLLAELAGSVEQGALGRELVCNNILPTVLNLCDDPSFRVRRSAAQALPRVLGGSTWELAKSKVLPAFTKLSQDEMYRVRKSTGECLVDMSRSFMILMESETNHHMTAIQDYRRVSLIPIAEQLLVDSNKFVRHGMMQFLGPFLASFFPFIDTPLPQVLPGSSEFDGSNHFGIGAQFFPHATSMVSRLNASSSATSATPIPIPALHHNEAASLQQQQQQQHAVSESQQLLQRLPSFIRANRMSILSLKAVLAHRAKHPPDPKDIAVITTTSKLLDNFCALSKVKTGDDNTDAEMRVYCAYSFPAVALLLGPEFWESKLRDCFLSLLNPAYGSSSATTTAGGGGGDDANNNNKDVPPPPLPVKRCLASSLHTVAQILGPAIALSDIVPVFREHFMRDTDDSVRINVIRIFPWLFSSLPPSARSETLSWWSEIIRGEDILGASRKRSSTNPLLLNWRQRDYVARSLPDLLGMMDCWSIHKNLWPVIKLLICDPICEVREDVIWSVPLILKAYCPENVVATSSVSSHKDDEQQHPSSSSSSSSTAGVKLNKRWSAESCQEVISWIKEAMLGVPPRMNMSSSSSSTNRNGSDKHGNFSQRQLYCHVCAAVALSLRFGEGDIMDDPNVDPAVNLSQQVKSLLAVDDFANESATAAARGPYQRLTPAEQKHVRRLLLYDILPPALAMKEDRVTNVRLTLMKTLRLLPEDLRGIASIHEVIHELEVEIETWESFVCADDQSVAASSSSVVKAKVIRHAGSSMEQNVMAASGEGGAVPPTSMNHESDSNTGGKAVSRRASKTDGVSRNTDNDPAVNVKLERRGSVGSDKEGTSATRLERRTSDGAQVVVVVGGGGSSSTLPSSSSSSSSSLPRFERKHSSSSSGEHGGGGGGSGTTAADATRKKRSKEAAAGPATTKMETVVRGSTPPEGVQDGGDQLMASI